MEPDERGHMGCPSMDYRRLLSHRPVTLNVINSRNALVGGAWGGAFTGINHYRSQ